MSITDYSVVRIGNVSEVTVTSSIGGTVYYHWYLDGVWQGATTEPVKTFWLDQDEQARVEVLDTADADYDYTANAPDGYPARKTLWWCRSTDDDVDHYRIEQQQDGGDWESLGRIHPRPNQWDFSLTTGRLDDLSDYAWQVIPVDILGNDGTALALDAETVVRTPDAPDFTATFDEGTTRVTFAEAV